MKRAPVSRIATGIASIVGTAACLVVSQAAHAAWPERPVRVVVAFSAGGTTDTLTRSMGNYLSRTLGQSFVVENKPGAGGNIGTEYVVRAEPDGYTLIVNSVGPIAVNPSLQKLSYDPLTDLVPIVQIAQVPNVLVVPHTSPIKNIKEFLEYVKTNPGVNYASTGVGTSSHLASHMLMQELKAKDAIHVPYKGADAVNDLRAGRVDFMFATIPSVMGQIQDGKLRALAVSSAERSASLPDLPTIAEVGFPGFDAGSWFGFFGPKGIPQEVVDTINKGVNDAIPELKEQMISQGADPAGGTPEKFASFIDDEYKKWAKIVEQLGAVMQ